MRRIARVVLAATGLVCLPGLALAKVKITVDLDTQTMHVESKDQTYDWKVSSGQAGYDTPPGSYHVLWTDKDHKSDEYDGAPMPNAIFFRPGFAIHGSYKSNWGHPASHGCVRLPVAKSAILFDLVTAEGADIKIVGGDPAAAVAADERQSRQGSSVLAADRAVIDPAYDDGFYRYAQPRSASDQAPRARARRVPDDQDLYGSVY